MAYKKSFRRYRYIGIDEANEMLKYLDNDLPFLDRIGYGIGSINRTRMEAEKSKRYVGLRGCYLVGVAESTVEITTSYCSSKENIESQPCTYVCDLNGEERSVTKGSMLFAEFQRIAHIPRAAETHYGKSLSLDESTGKYLLSAAPALDYRPEFDDRIVELHDVYEYDLNSAYSAAQLDKIPDLRMCLGDGIVHKGEVGFYSDESNWLRMCETGEEAEYIFKLMDTPTSIRRYIYKYYRIKSKSTGVEKLNAKAHLNFPVGYFQRYNPFYRAYVVEMCNKTVWDLVDTHEEIFMWNTDAVFSTKPIPELEIGEGIGQWKVTMCDTFRMDGLTYQINDDMPKYRGIPKGWFKNFEKEYGRPFKLGTDKLPDMMNDYYYDIEQNQIIRRNYGTHASV